MLRHGDRWFHTIEGVEMIELVGSKIKDIKVGDTYVIIDVEKNEKKYAIVIEYNEEYEHDRTVKPILFYYVETD